MREDAPERDAASLRDGRAVEADRGIAVVSRTFPDLLAEFESRFASRGLALQELAAIVGVAELFPAMFCAAYDADGRYTWVCGTARSVLGIDPARMLGRSITEFFGREWCEERIEIIRRVLATNSIIATVEIFAGRRYEGAVFPAGIATPSPMAVMLGRFGLALSLPSPSDADALKLVQLAHADWGRLKSLSRRELEVLRLIARGMGNPEIARTVHRTKRAVEWHIKNLYLRLGCNERTELYRLGLEAGLADIDDVHWVQIFEHVHQEPGASGDLNGVNGFPTGV